MEHTKISHSGKLTTYGLFTTMEQGDTITWSNLSSLDAGSRFSVHVGNESVNHNIVTYVKRDLVTNSKNGAEITVVSGFIDLTKGTFEKGYCSEYVFIFIKESKGNSTVLKLKSKRLNQKDSATKNTTPVLNIENNLDKSIHNQLVQMLSVKGLNKKKVDEIIRYLKVYKGVSLERATEYVENLRKELSL